MTYRVSGLIIKNILKTQVFASVCLTQPGRESLFMLRTHDINFDIYFENDLQKCKIAKGLNR